MRTVLFSIVLGFATLSLGGVSAPAYADSAEDSGQDGYGDGAAEAAGEPGGVGCSSVGTTGSVALFLLGGLLLMRRWD